MIVLAVRTQSDACVSQLKIIQNKLFAVGRQSAWYQQRTVIEVRWESWILLWYQSQIRGTNPVTNSFPIPEISRYYSWLLLHHPLNHHAQLEYGVCGGGEIRPRCAGGRETIWELWLTHIRVENGSFIHLSHSFFINKNILICAIILHSPNFWLGS